MNDNLARAPYAPAWAAAPATALPSPAPAPTPRRHIEAVPATGTRRRARPRLFYAVIAVAGMGVILAVKLLLSGVVTQGAYIADDLAVQNKALERAVQTSTETLDRVKSPQYLAANAEALGMVANASPVYLRLSDGAVLGAPSAANGSAGLGAASSLVPNSLISGIPLVTQIAAETPVAAVPDATAAPADAAGAAVATAPTPPAEPTVLPTPVTH